VTARISTEVLIVGSGVAGAMCAWALASKGVKVAILEAGPRIERGEIVEAFKQSPNLDLSAGYPNPPWAPRPDWSGGDDTYIEQIGPDILAMEYLRVVGGTTWHWSGNTVRLLPSEFEMRSRYGVGEDWPIGYQTLETFYTQAEYEMGVCGDSTADDGSPRSEPFPMPPMPKSYSDQHIIERLKGSGIDFTARPTARNSQPFDDRSRCEGFGSCSPICPSGAQYAAMVHVRKAEALGARVIENARVDRLVADTNGRVSEVHFGRPDGSRGVAVGRIVVAAANGIETPRLLLMSGTEHYPDGIANRSGAVGRYHMDHPGIYCRMILPQPVYAGRGPESTMTSFTFRDGAFRRQRAAWTMSTYNRTHLYDITSQSLLNGQAPPGLDEAIHHRALHEIEIDIHMEQLPERNNGISLDWSRLDSAGQPGLRLFYSYGAYEHAGFEFSREIFRKVGASLGAVQSYISKPYSHHHLMGMTRMGDDPNTSVVNADCRSHDHENLYLLSSSVFPTSGTANPTLTIAALSLRAANSIISRLENPSE